MSRRLSIAIAFALAVVLTIVGLFKSILYKDVPLVPLALWFPVVVITDTRAEASYALSLLQFPCFATAFALAIRRWRVSRVLAVLAIVYALLAGVAFAIVKLGLGPSWR